jgi:glyoxylase-like metal-dependent hydrolase (beta-lactamase superfamily II)
MFASSIPWTLKIFELTIYHLSKSFEIFNKHLLVHYLGGHMLDSIGLGIPHVCFVNDIVEFLFE